MMHQSRVIDPSEAKTFSADAALRPYFDQLKELNSHVAKASRQTGHSKEADDLIKLVHLAINELIEHGQIVANDNPKIADRVYQAYEELHDAGSCLLAATESFVHEPSSQIKRSALLKAVFNLYPILNKLLSIADMVDISNLVKMLHELEDHLQLVLDSRDENSLDQNLDNFAYHLDQVDDAVKRRQFDLKDEDKKDQLSAARANLLTASQLLNVVSKTHFKYENLPPAKANCAAITSEIREFVNRIVTIIQSPVGNEESPIGETASVIKKFKSYLVGKKANSCSEQRLCSQLQELLEKITNNATILACSSFTGDNRREHIVLLCKSLNKTLQILITEYQKEMGYTINITDKKITKENIRQISADLVETVYHLEYVLRIAVADHVSEALIAATVPLQVLIDAATNKSNEELENYAQSFSDDAESILQAGELACAISTNAEGIKLVKLASNYVRTYRLQVVNAAEICSQVPSDMTVENNMDRYKELWNKYMRALIRAIDEITSVDDFLLASQSHIRKDLSECARFIGEENYYKLDGYTVAVLHRMERVEEVVLEEMDNFPNTIYSERVKRGVATLKELADIFGSYMDKMSKSMEDPTVEKPDENLLLELCNKIYEAVLLLRRYVLLNRQPNDYESIDEEIDSDDPFVSLPLSIENNGEMVNIRKKIPSTRAAYRSLPIESRSRIENLSREFKREEIRLQKEISQWTHSNHQAIKFTMRLCLLLLDISELARGVGPLKSVSDLTFASQRVEEVGSQFNRFVLKISETNTSKRTHSDLVNLVHKVTLYCQQLKKVSNDTRENHEDQLFLLASKGGSAVIESCKNLMMTIFLILKIFRNGYNGVDDKPID
ncbi:Catenin alpha-2 [Trichoplax sp. H2]|nr:Catenin alpha-2 [Trichoplax sp. H2]|eukprot:RDD37161.1 Catenin alpha-2 [Trichoplax sp. H2]